MNATFSIDDAEFDAIREFVRSKTGITLGESKRALVVARLGKRLRHHGYTTFREYHEHLTGADADGSEMLEMINCITTNKTEFFREMHHFTWLRERFVPEVRARAKASGSKKVRIWSAGCSTGQEPYSIATVLADELPPTEWDVRVLASDVDTEVLAEAQAGEYDSAAIAGVPDALRLKYFEPRGSQWRVVRSIRDMVTFRRINFIDDPWPIRTRFDIIFCRNVTIYFDRPTQARLYERFISHLAPRGYIVAGHSENLHWLGHLLTPLGETVYQVAGGEGRKRKSSRAPPQPMREVPIQSGGLHVSEQPTIVRTVLGSCVAVCLFDTEARVGGMNHFMLPDGCETDWAPTRFGTHAMRALIDEVLKRGAQRGRLRAKVFGGAHVLVLAGSSRAIPDLNIDFVHKFLADERIPIVAEKVGGDLPMQVRFETHTGRAFMRRIEAADAEAEKLTSSERRYRAALNAVARSSERGMRVAERSST